MTTVGFIGLGAMGLPMAKNLAAHGFTVRGFDMRTTAVDALAEAGGVPTASAAEAAREAQRPGADGRERGAGRGGAVRRRSARRTACGTASSS